jgi:hypothetical protein
MAKIYLASSWKNADSVRHFENLLLKHGHHVDCFCTNNPERFTYSPKNLNLEDYNEKTYLELPQVKRIYLENKKWLDWCNVVIMIHPCGRSSHLEAGYAIGSGKKLLIFVPSFTQGEFDAMYLFADLITDSMEEILTFLEEVY